MREKCKKQQKKNKQRQKEAMGTEAIVKGWELNGFVVHLSQVQVIWLRFFQLICKACLIFMSNLELALSIILRQRELYESKHVSKECRCLKIWDLLFPLICSSILVLKWRQISPMSARTIAGTSKFIYQERFQIIRNCVFIFKIIFNFEPIKN